MNEDLVLIEKLKSLIQRAMIYAQHSHDFIFDENTDDSIAVSYLNIAASKFAAAESLYYSRIDVLKRNEAEQLFYLFDAYMRELLTNYRTNHSHQWTDIEYNRLREYFDYSAFAFSKNK